MEPAPDPSSLASPGDRLILVVDDDEHVRNILEMTIKNEGFQVVMATNGLEAAERIRERAPDLIISDLMMQGQGGYEFLREMQSQGVRIPVIVITGSRLDDSTVNMIKQEGNVLEFVKKPLSISSFVMTLHQHARTKPPSVQRPRGINERRW